MTSVVNILRDSIFDDERQGSLESVTVTNLVLRLLGAPSAGSRNRTLSALRWRETFVGEPVTPTSRYRRSERAAHLGGFGSRRALMFDEPMGIGGVRRNVVPLYRPALVVIQ
jgi:hypothetical protein